MIKPKTQYNFDCGCLHLFYVNITLNDGQQDDNDEEEECNVEDDSVDFIVITVGRFDFVTDATTSSYTFVQVEYEALQQRKSLKNS